MFWSGNYMAVRELNSLLKDENVTLSQVLEADDVLQECKADNKALIQFLTRPDILAELVTLITEEPPKNVELSLQYRHATIACEVLTSQLPTLSDRLSMDTAQMHRLCDFINREPPLNPLLASYFSKTIEMLLERSPKQDWYLYHIVCLRVLDFLKARRDFLPNLLRHLHTSAILDALKCFIRLNDLFNKLIMEWLEEHQFLESLIAIICGTYEPPPLAPSPCPCPAPAPTPSASPAGCELEKGQRELSEKDEREGIEKGDLDAQDKEVLVEDPPPDTAQATGDASQADAEATATADAATAAERVRGVAAANAASLLADIILNGCAPDYSQVSPAGNARSRTALALVATATSALGVRALLQAVFTSAARARRHALVHGAHVLLAMRRADRDAEADAEQSGCAGARSGVELAVAPHLPLLHTALLQPPEPYQHEPSAVEAPADGGGGAAPAAGGAGPGPGPGPEVPAPAPAAPAPSPAAPAPCPPAPRAGVGAARLQVAALLAALCSSEVDEVASTMLTLGTPGVLIDMFFAHPDNNFLHAQVLVMVRNALSNRAYRTQYARHILEECDLFNRLMDVYEENETKRGTASAPRAGYMGHVVLLLRALAPALEHVPDLERWASASVHQLIQRLDTPLGGYYPSENTYEVEADGMVEVETRLYNLNMNNQYSDFASDEDLNEVASSANINKFLELSNQRMCDQANMWDDAPEGTSEERGEGEGEGEGDIDGDGERQGEDDTGAAPARHTVRDVLAPVSPWETSFEESNMAGEGWAQFSADGFGSSADPFANTDAFAAADAFANDGFTKRERFDGAAFADDSFGEGAAAEEFASFWGYQEKDGDANGAGGVEQSLRGMDLDKPLDELSSSLADNLRTAMSSMTPEVIANIVNANMTPALEVPLEDVSNVTDASNTNAKEASNISVTEASNVSTKEASNINVTETANITAKELSNVSAKEASNICVTEASNISASDASIVDVKTSVTEAPSDLKSSNSDSNADKASDSQPASEPPAES